MNKRGNTSHLNTQSMKSSNIGSMTVKKISAIGNSCNFCLNKSNEVLEVGGQGLCVRFCPECFKLLNQLGCEFELESNRKGN